MEVFLFNEKDEKVDHLSGLYNKRIIKPILIRDKLNYWII